jgi:hypothetical protein
LLLEELVEGWVDVSKLLCRKRCASQQMILLSLLAGAAVPEELWHCGILRLLLLQPPGAAMESSA